MCTVRVSEREKGSTWDGGVYLAQTDGEADEVQVGPLGADKF